MKVTKTDYNLKYDCSNILKPYKIQRLLHLHRQFYKIFLGFPYIKIKREGFSNNYII